MRALVHAAFDFCMRHEMKNTVLVFLYLYKKAVSPIRNWRNPKCSHHIVYGTGGCSSAAIGYLETMPMALAREAIDARLAACVECYEHLASIETVPDHDFCFCGNKGC